MTIAFDLTNPNTPTATLKIALSGLDTVLALKREIAVPLAAVTQLQCSPPEAAEWFHSGLRVGTHLPGVVSKGTWWGTHGKMFYFFHKVPATAAEADATVASRVLGITLDPAAAPAGVEVPFIRLVLEVPEGSTAAEWKNKIDEAKAQH
ncbi:hypothetical protein H9P43_001509 [Blastocladiella emersonii ATCC 22665]|nr:hypothetical protein H9P43_001509 [Blastocladiella emersonii ATCC 22665]